MISLSNKELSATIGLAIFVFIAGLAIGSASTIIFCGYDIDKGSQIVQPEHISYNFNGTLYDNHFYEDGVFDVESYDGKDMEKITIKKEEKQ